MAPHFRRERSIQSAAGFTDRQWGGNLSGQTWRSAQDGITRAFGYRYDAPGRLVQADFGAYNPAAFSFADEINRYRFSAASYDPNGNLLTLRRTGQVAAATRQQPAQFAELTYDAEGAATRVSVEGLSALSYNHLNLTRRVVLSSAPGDSLVVRWAADGHVLVYVATESERAVDVDEVEVRYGPALQVQEQHCDPFGLELVGLSRNGLVPTNRYLFNGKEAQAELGLTGWTDHGWRMFDAALGRWHVVDPAYDEAGQISWSGYQFGFDNPVRYNDLDGRVAGEGGDDWYKADRSKNGLSNNGSAASQPSTLSLIAPAFSKLVGQTLAMTDVNDATVLTTMGTRGSSNAINVDGTKATELDKGFAVAGAAIPIVSGALLKKGFEAVGEYAVNAYSKFKGSGLTDGHHIIQNAAVESLPGYSKSAATSVHLPGGGKGSAHHAATTTQNARRKLGDGGTYNADRRLANRALRSAGVDVDNAKSLVRKADNYFSGIGVTPQTQTVIPKK